MISAIISVGKKKWAIFDPAALNIEENKLLSWGNSVADSNL
jgi:hypothetical protein